MRDEAIAKVSDNNEKWMELCVKSIEDSYNDHPGWTFTGEDLRHQCEMLVGCPAHSNAWGALVNTLVRRKIIKPTGEYRAMRDDSSHARTPVYTK